MFIEQHYDSAAAWRKRWNDLAHNTTSPRMSRQQDYIEYRAELANTRIAKIMRIWDLHKPEIK